MFVNVNDQGRLTQNRPG